MRKHLFFLRTGGTLGLFTGMSILSMIEMVFWLAKLPSTLCRVVKTSSSPIWKSK